MVRPPCCDKLNVKRGLWTAEEDAKILAYVSKHGTGNWTALPKKAGLRRCGKSCRLRWTNYLRPDLKHDSFTPQEEELIVRLHAAIGSRWSIIAQQLPGRTDNDVKNYWNTKLRKKLSEMGIDPVTHKPFSQILADYGNIGCIPKYGTRIGSLTRDLKNAFISKPEPAPEGNPNINSHLTTATANVIMSPKAEPIQKCFLNNTSTTKDAIINPNPSMDLYDQLQAIKLVTEASSCANYETIPAHFINNAGSSSSTSSPSSSSSTCSTAAQEKSALNFSWRDFLLEDALLPSEYHPQEQGSTNPILNLSSKNQAQNVTLQQGENAVIPQGENNGEINGKDHQVEVDSFRVLSSSSSSPHTSFVEAMLNQENENFLDFPSLLEEQFSY